MPEPKFTKLKSGCLVAAKVYRCLRITGTNGAEHLCSLCLLSHPSPFSLMRNIKRLRRRNVPSRRRLPSRGKGELGKAPVTTNLMTIIVRVEQATAYCVQLPSSSTYRRVSGEPRGGGLGRAPHARWNTHPARPPKHKRTHKAPRLGVWPLFQPRGF